MDYVWFMGLGLSLIFNPVADMVKLNFRTSTQNLIFSLGGLIWTVLLIWGFFHFTLGYYLLSILLGVAVLIPLRSILFNNAVIAIIIGSLISFTCLGVFN